MRKYFSYILIFISLSVSAQNIDIDLLKNINVGRNKSLDPACRFISESVSPLSVASPVILFGIGYLKKDCDIKQKSLVIGASIVTATLISTSLKYSIDRTRPFDKYPFIEQAVSVHTASFPSGHTSSAFSTATSLSLAFPKWYVIAPSYLWASSVAYSRMHLGVHYPSDVLAGAFIGAGSSYLCYKLNQRLAKRRK